MKRAGTGLLLIGVLLIGANLRSAITSVGPLLGDIRTTLEIGGATASILISAPLVAFALISPIAPALAARLGVERALAASLLMLAAAIAGRSLPLTGAIWMGTAALGVAIAMMNVLLPALVKRDYPQHIGAITGLYSVAQSAGAALAAGLAVPAASLLSGWRVSLGIWAVPALIAFAIFLPQLRAAHAPAAGAHAPMRVAHGRAPWRSLLAWQITLFMGLQSTVYYVLITWWPTIEQSEGISAATAGWHQFVFQIISILGNVSAGLFIQRLRDQRGLIAVYALLVFIAIGGLLLLPRWSLLWAAFAGISSGGSIVVALSLFGLRTATHEQAAALSGMAQSIGYLLAAFGPILFGLLHDLSGGWHAPLIALLGVIVAQFVLGTLAGRARIVHPH